MTNFHINSKIRDRFLNTRLFKLQMKMFAHNEGCHRFGVTYTRAGVGNSFGFAGHIKDKLGIRGPVQVHVNWFYVFFVIKQILSWCLMCFHSQYSYLENFKCSSRATLRCLAGCMWPAGRTLPRPALGSRYRYKGGLVIRTVLSLQVGLVIRTRGVSLSVFINRPDYPYY